MAMDGGMPGMQEQFPAMAMDGGMPGMQEQFLIARDGVNAENAGAIFGRRWPWMAGMPARKCSRHLRALPTSTWVGSAGAISGVCAKLP